jgi:hypothetical protein
MRLKRQHRLIGELYQGSHVDRACLRIRFGLTTGMTSRFLGIGLFIKPTKNDYVMKICEPRILLRVDPSKYYNGLLT